jgi:hypothetical protein
MLPPAAFDAYSFRRRPKITRDRVGPKASIIQAIVDAGLRPQWYEARRLACQGVAESTAAIDDEEGSARGHGLRRGMQKGSAVSQRSAILGDDRPTLNRPF